MITVIAGIVMLGASAMFMTPGLWTELGCDRCVRHSLAGRMESE